MGFFSWFSKDKTPTEQTVAAVKHARDLRVGETFEVSVTSEECLLNPHSLTSFNHKLADKLGCDIAEVVLNDNGIYFKAYDPETGDEYFLEEAEGNVHMADFLEDIEACRKEITPFTLRLRYAGVNIGVIADVIEEV